MSHGFLGFFDEYVRTPITKKLRKKPTFFPLLLSLVLIGSIYGGWKYFEHKGGISPSDGLQMLAAFLSIIILFFTFFNLFSKMATSDISSNKSLGEHQYFEQFSQHLEVFQGQYAAQKKGQLDGFNIVVSTLAYGIGTQNPKAEAGLFLSMLEHAIKDAEKTAKYERKRINLNFFIWNDADHKNTFGLHESDCDTNNERTRKMKALMDDKMDILKRVVGFLEKINALRNSCNECYRFLHVNFFFTTKLEWRLFQFDVDGQHEQTKYSMMTIFSPINSNTMQSANWHHTSYTAHGVKAKDDFLNFTAQLEKASVKDNSIITKPRDYVSRVFDVPIKSLN